MSSNIKIKDNSKETIAEIRRAAQAALEAVGLAAEGYAKQSLTASGAVDTGALRESVTHTVNGDTAVVGTNKEYAAFVEFGTGRYAEGGGGTGKDRWVYRGDDGKAHIAFPMKPRPYIKPSIADHIEEYKQLVSNQMSGIGK